MKIQHKICKSLKKNLMKLKKKKKVMKREDREQEKERELLQKSLSEYRTKKFPNADISKLPEFEKYKNGHFVGYFSIANIQHTEDIILGAPMMYINENTMDNYIFN